MPPKFCPECREEYVHTASLCANCDVALVLEADLAVSAGPEELPPASEMICIRASAVGWAMALSAKLSEAGIPHRVQSATPADDDGSRTRPGQNLPFGVFVLPEDLELAQQIDIEHTASEIPDMPDSGAFDAADGACPACGDPIDADADECPGCGLALLTLE